MYVIFTIKLETLKQLILLTLTILFSTQIDAQVRAKSEDSDSAWIELGEENQLSITSSTESIQIEIRDVNGKWQPAGEFQIAQSTRFFAQPWVFVVLVLLVGFFAYLTMKFFLNKSRKDAIIGAKVAELERSALRAQMNPHFIFNSLNSIQSYIANNENDMATRFLAKFARLIRTTLSHSRANKITLQDEVDAISLYMDLEKMRFKEKFDFELTMDEDVDTQDIDVPPLLIQPYLENAIIHGMAQTRSQGKINLYYIQKGKYLYATVTDNGIGIEQSKKMKKKDSLHKSVGMTITQKRLEMLDEGNRDKKVVIEEIKDRKGEVLGTKVEVKIRVE